MFGMALADHQFGTSGANQIAEDTIQIPPYTNHRCTDIAYSLCHVTEINYLKIK